MRKLYALLLLLSAVSLPLAAQTVNVRGRVTMPDGSALPGVTVSIDEMGVTAVTDSEGRYTLAVPANRARGQVKVTATLSGFQTKSATVDLGGGDATHDFVLRVSYGQEITVGSRAIGAEQEKAV